MEGLFVGEEIHFRVFEVDGFIFLLLHYLYEYIHSKIFEDRSELHFLWRSGILHFCNNYVLVL